MKYIFLWIVCMVNFYLVSKGQAPVITSADCYLAGERQTSLTADTTGVNPGNFGPDQTWDFSFLTQSLFLRDTNITEYIDPAKTPYTKVFPDANLSIIGGDQRSYSYMKTSGTMMEALGSVILDSAFAPVNLKYDDPLIMFQYPVKMGDLNYDEYTGKCNINGSDLYLNGSLTQKADAYGTMKIRNKTYNHVLRIYSVQISKEKFDLGINGILNQVEIDNTYNFYTPGKKSAILTITNSSSFQNDVEFSDLKTVTFNDYDPVNFSAIDDDEPTKPEFSLFPNPSNGSMELSVMSGKESVSAITCINQLGQVVLYIGEQKIHEGQNVVRLELSSQPKGIYYISLNNGFAISIQKLVLE